MCRVQRSAPYLTGNFLSFIILIFVTMFLSSSLWSLHVHLFTFHVCHYVGFLLSLSTKWEICKWTKQSWAASEPSSSSIQVRNSAKHCRHFTKRYFVFSSLWKCCACSCRCKRAFQHQWGGAPERKGLCIIGILLQTEIPRAAGKVNDSSFDKPSRVWFIC